MKDTTAPPLPVLLRHRERMLRMRRQPGVVDARHGRVRLEPAPAPALALRRHADAERLQALQHDPGIERRQAHAGAAHHRHQLLVDDLAGPHTAPGQHAALAVEVLGAGMDDQVGAQLQRRCSAGVQKQLSTASSAPASCAIVASAAMSHTSVSGLLGVSANSSRVAGRTAARHAPTSVCDTKLVSTPNARTPRRAA